MPARSAQPAKGLTVSNGFVKDRSGSTAVLFGILLPVLCVGAGIAVDAARWFQARSITSAALDAAVLAGARHMQVKPDDITGALLTAKSYYDANVLGRLPLQSDSVSFVAVDNNTAITATGAASLKTSFLTIAGIDALPITPSSAAAFPKAVLATGGYGGSNIEVAVVLDVTGSMCDDGAGPCSGGTKLDGLKSAASDLVNIVVWADQSQYTSKVALVPFSTRVRVGPDGGGTVRMKALTDLDPAWSGWMSVCTQWTGSGSSETGGNWQCQQTQTVQVSNWKVMPCVTDRFYETGDVYDYTDDAPGSDKWLNAHDGTRMVVSRDSTDTTPSGYRGSSSVDPAYQWNYTSDGSCSDVAQQNEVMPLSADKLALQSRIAGLEAYGSTSGALGTAFGWYMLSPNWSGIWTGPSAPRPYSDLSVQQSNGAPLLRKVAVIMSDGGYNTMRGWKDQSQQTVSDHAKQLCANMKAQGVEVFTVGFALDQLSSAERAIAEDTLRSCGTDVHHFYETLTVPELQQAFRQIALQLSSLTLAR